MEEFSECKALALVDAGMVILGPDGMESPYNFREWSLQYDQETIQVRALQARVPGPQLLEYEAEIEWPDGETTTERTTYSGSFIVHWGAK